MKSRSDDRPLILVADDDAGLLRFLELCLGQAGYATVTVRNGLEALARLDEATFDLVILDVDMPGLDGYQTCLQIRAEYRSLPILMLSKVQKRELGFEIGVDDYLPKPFHRDELLLRVKKLLQSRPANAETSAALDFDDGYLYIDISRGVVRKDGEGVSLGRKELGLLALLLARRGMVVSQEKLMRQLYGSDAPRDQKASRRLRVAVHNVRGKIERDPSRPQYIRNVPHLGYTFGG